MDGTTIERQKLVEAISTLPDEVLVELASFLDYLRYKTTRVEQPASKPSGFLLSIAALGTSDESDVSQRDEEILRNEIDPIHGWSLKSDNPT